MTAAFIALTTIVFASLVAAHYLSQVYVCRKTGVDLRDLSDDVINQVVDPKMAKLVKRAKCIRKRRNR